MSESDSIRGLGLRDGLDVCWPDNIAEPESGFFKTLYEQTLDTTMTAGLTVHDLKRLLDAFNRHDLDAIMEYFTEDAVFDMPHGPDPYGRQYIGKAAVSLDYQMSIMEKTSTGWPGIGDALNGHSQARGRPEKRSRCEAATCSSSRMERSPRKTRFGRSYSRRQGAKPSVQLR
jgi:hypothetical protein